MFYILEVFVFLKRNWLQVCAGRDCKLEEVCRKEQKKTIRLVSNILRVSVTWFEV